MPAARPVLGRLLSRIVVSETGCWVWQGYTQPNGYGYIGAGAHRTRPVHRVSYEWFVGPVPTGRNLDHLCRNRACCNPFHLEAVTQRENCRRGYWGMRRHCKHGHEFTPENTAFYQGYRACRACARDKQAVYRRQRQEAAA